MIVLVPTCLVGGLAFFDAALHVISDKAEMIKKKVVKSRSYYENESFAEIPLETLFPPNVSRTLVLPDSGLIDEPSSTLQPIRS